MPYIREFINNRNLFVKFSEGGETKQDQGTDRFCDSERLTLLQGGLVLVPGGN